MINRYWLIFKTGIKNLWYWFPVIWKDRNWDYSYILGILSHKMKSQAKYIGQYGNHLSMKRDAEIMMTCVRLIEKLKDDIYADEYLNYFEMKTFSKNNNDVNQYTWSYEITKNNIQDYFKKYPLIYKKVMTDSDIANSEIIDIAGYMSYINHQRAKKLLFKIIEENIERWWD